MAKYSIEGATLTAIADSVRNKTGGTDPIPVSNLPAEIDGIQNGVDTSDATATAEDIVDGKTAYVNGEKIIGTCAVYPSNQTQSKISNNQLEIWGNYLRSTTEITARGIYEEGHRITLNYPLADIGDATPEDVRAGKTFTSSAGVKVEGTGNF